MLKQNSVSVVMPKSWIVSPLFRCILLRRLNEWAGEFGPAPTAGGTGYRASLDLGPVTQT